MVPTAFRRSVLVTLPLLLAACGDDSTGPASVAGQYAATTFNLVQGATTTDVLAAGGSLTITLTANGTTTGQLFVPAALNGGTPLTASMDGTFTLSNGLSPSAKLPTHSSGTCPSPSSARRWRGVRTSAAQPSLSS